MSDSVIFLISKFYYKQTCSLFSEVNKKLPAIYVFIRINCFPIYVCDSYFSDTVFGIRNLYKIV